MALVATSPVTPRSGEKQTSQVGWLSCANGESGKVRKKIARKIVKKGRFKSYLLPMDFVVLRFLSNMLWIIHLLSQDLGVVN